MPKATTKLVLANGKQEMVHVHTIVTQASEGKESLFLGRFLSDLPSSNGFPDEWKAPDIVVRQYGCSCRMNACPQLAEAGRIDLGMEEAETAIRSGRYRTVLLSQVLTAVEENLLTAQDILWLIDTRPEHVTLILTGETAPAAIAAQCDSWPEGHNRNLPRENRS